MNPSSVSRSLFLLLTLTIAFIGFSQPKVDRNPPEIFTNLFAERLTPWEKVADGRTAFPNDNSGGVILLRERFDHVEENGDRFTVYHNIDYGNTESGADSNEELTYTYDAERQKIYLVSARSIQKDGTIQEVAENATFIQSPQYEASNSLYTSEAELKIIFPNVKIGTAIEAIVLIEDRDPVMRNEVNGVRTFQRYWPIYRNHYSLELPESYATRIKYETMNGSFPEAQIDTIETDRTRYTWIYDKVESADWEARAPQFYYRLPALWWSTAESWDTVAAWFNGLISERDELGPELTEKVKKWVKGLKNRQDIINRLSEIVANEVRYTGLEFGLAGYQPYSCETVWKNQYGDCKDKANLLRALLKSQGIEAYIVLLQTSGHGRVNKRAPRHGAFNHAILAIAEEDGNYQFVDPTIEFLPAGQVGFGDSSREVLVIKGDKAVWARTPDKMVGGIHVSIDAKLETSGELTGWVTLNADGSDASYYTGFYNDKIPEDRLSAFLNLAEDFIPGVSVLDVEYEEKAHATDKFTVRGYIHRKSGTGIADTIPFPYPIGWLPDFDAKSERIHPYRAIRRVESVNATITLPEGYQLSSTPEAFIAESDASVFNAQWYKKDNKITAKLSWHPTKAILSPDEYQTYRQSVNALKTWLEQPAIIDASGYVENDENKGEKLENFPMLSSGDRQLKLVENKYPSGSNDELRKLAFKKVIQWFPDEPDTIFKASLNIIRVEWTDQNSRETSRKISKLLSKLGSQITAQNKAWGEFLKARSAWIADDDPTAIKSLVRLAQNEELSAFRRGWSAYYAALMLQDSSVKKSLKLLSEHSQYESEARPSIDSVHTRLLLQKRGFKEFQEFFEDLVQNRQDQLAESLDYVASALSNHWDSFSEKDQAKLFEYFEDYFQQNQRFEDAYETWTALSESIRSETALTDFAQWIQDYLEQNSPSWDTSGAKDSDTTPDQLTEKIVSSNDNKDYGSLFDACLQLLTHKDASYDDQMKYLRWAFWWMDSRNVELDLLDKLGELSLSLRADEERELYRTWLLLGEHFREKKNFEKAKRYFHSVAKTTDAENYQRVAAAAGLAKIAFYENDKPAAEKQFAVIQELYSNHTDGSDYLLLNLFYLLEEQRLDEALAVLKKIPTIDQQYRDESDYSDVTAHAINGLENEAQLLEYWKHAQEWKQSWEKLCTDNAVSPATLQDMLVIDDINELASQTTAALESKDKEDFLYQMGIIARLAQAIPIFGVDFSSHANSSVSISPEFGRTLQDCTIELVDGAPTVIESVGISFIIKHAVTLLDSQQDKAAIPVCKKLLELTGKESAQGQAALRLWLLGTRKLKEGYEEPRKLMEDLLKSDIEINDRVRFVRSLSDLYYTIKDYAACISINEQEANHPTIAANDDLVKILGDRVNLLRGEAERETALTKSITAWIENRNYQWYERIEPTSFNADDQTYAELPATWPNGSLANTIKANLLYSLEEDNPIDEREECLQHAISLAQQIEKDANHLRDLTIDAFENAPLPHLAKAQLYMGGLLGLCSSQHPKQAQELLEHPYTKSLNQPVIGNFKKLVEAIELYNESSDRLEESLNILLEVPVNYAVDEQIIKTLNRLVYLGQEDLADTFLEKSKSMKLSSFADKQLAGYRVGWLRTIKQAKALAPLHTGLRKMALERLEVDNPKRPETMDTVIDYERFKAYSKKEKREILAYFYHEGIFPLGDARVTCFDLRTAVALGHGETDFALELLQFTLGLGLPEHITSEWLATAVLLVDVDIEGNRLKSEEIVTQYLATKNLSENSKIMIETSTRPLTLRTATEKRPDSLFSQETEELFDEQFLLSLRLGFHFTRSQWKEIGRLLDTQDYSSLENPTDLAIAYKGLLKLGREDEAFLFRDVIDEKIKDNIEQSWVNGASIEFDQLLSCLVILEEPEKLPQELVVHIDSDLGNNLYRALNHMERAYLATDWNTVTQKSHSALEFVPDMYVANGYLGMALLHQNKKEEAVPHIKLFLDHCRDSPVYPEILEAYNELKNPVENNE